jgi:hypothetical protein
MQAIVMRGIIVTEDGEIGLGDLANSYYFWFNISCFSLLCYEFVPIKYRKLAIFTSAFLLFLCAFFARRGGIFMTFLYFFGMLYLYL